MTTAIRRRGDMDADKVKFRGKGVTGTATAGQTTNIDHKITEARLLDGLELITVGTAAGDAVTLQVVDVDNVLGYGAGTVLDEFGTSWYLASDRQSQGQIQLPYSAEILVNLYVRLKYISVGQSNVSVYCNYFLHKYMV